jgi:hypothetical protein
MRTGITQGSLLLPIFSLISNASLVILQLPDLPASVTSVANNVNVLALSKLIEMECKMLQVIHEYCLELAR